MMSELEKSESLWFVLQLTSQTIFSRGKSMSLVQDIFVLSVQMQNALVADLVNEQQLWFSRPKSGCWDCLSEINYYGLLHGFLFLR